MRTLHTRGCSDDECLRTYPRLFGDGEVVTPRNFQCNRCDRVVGWRMGANDDTPSLCDDCANVVAEDWS